MAKAYVPSNGLTKNDITTPMPTATPNARVREPVDGISNVQSQPRLPYFEEERSDATSNRRRYSGMMIIDGAGGGGYIRVVAITPNALNMS